ncbi:Type I restriction-modification system, specificity subunit S [Microcystis aeruginosa NIES-2481]|nr:Type I restriction-modification system, specificity subunit S [Microcystis aeruginosa NIES-2481]
MTKKWQPYPTYKDSGVEWLGAIPEHWEVKKLKYISYLTMGQSPSSDDYNHEGYGSPFLQGNAEFGNRNPEAKIFCATVNKYAEKGDILISVRAPVGALNEADRRYGIGRGLCSIRPRDIIIREFAWYLIQVVKVELNFLSTGSTYEAVALTDVSNLSCLLPPLPEQQKIAEFLDQETGKIDKLITKKERLIKLLKEKRTALISHAVTKGLNPDVPMKDSGVEWLGEIPEHWEVKKCKQLSLIKRGASPRPIDDPSFFDDDGAYSWVRISDVTASNKYLETSEQKLSELGKSKSIALEPGELFVSICATVGKPIITNIKCCIHDGFVYFPFLRENREYLFYIFSGGELYKGMGKQGTQLNLNTDIIGDIKLPIPPFPNNKKSPNS